MTFGPDFGDVVTPTLNPLVYPRRVLIEVFENFFSQDQLITPEGITVNPFKYVAEGNEPGLASRLIIADSYSQELRKKDARPTILISRGPLSFAGSAINSRRDSLLRNTLPTGSPTIGLESRSKSNFSDMVAMPISINCYARNVAEVEQLAWLVAGVLKFFRQQIKDGARIHKIDNPSVGAPAPFKSDSSIDLFVINITLMMYQTIVWVMQTTATSGAIGGGLTNFSVSGYPKVWNNPITVVPTPQEIIDSPGWIARWFSPG